MSNAKVIIKQQDRSAIVPSLSGIDIGTVVNAKWGPVTPLLTANANKLVDFYYKPDNKKGSSWNGAELLLASSNKLWVTRAIHGDARYSASLVRFKIDEPDFNSYPAPTDTPDVIVKPLTGGIALDALDSYEFPQYLTSRVYVDSGATVTMAAVGKSIEVSNLTTTGGHEFATGDLISFGTTVNDSSAFFEIDTAGIVVKAEHIITTAGPLTGTIGTEVKKLVTGSPVSYSPKVYLTKAVTASNQLTVDQHDVVLNGDTITLDENITTSAVAAKDLINRDAKVITFTSNVTAALAAKVQWMESTEFEYRDAFLVVAKCPGDLGDKIKVGTRASTNYDNAFFLDVYFDGVREESYEVTRDVFVDGFGFQMQMETKINGISKYIEVKDNTVEESRAIPLITDYGVWRRNSTDLFPATVISTVEDVVAGDVFVTVTNASTLALNNRIKFSVSGPEYKVEDKTSNTITLDRPLIETKVTSGSLLYKFDSTLADAPNGIFAGTQHYKFSKISNLASYKISDTYTISGIAGKVLDAGTNNQAGGFDGSAITVFDVIEAFNKMGNKEKYRISIFCDNGFAYPEVAIAIDEIQKRTNLSHGYLSTPYAAEKAADPVTALVNYRNSTNLNSEFVSMFSGWIQVTDTYNQTKVWVAPSVFGVNSQSFVTRNYYIFTPAAGWVYGRLNGLEISVKFEDGERDALIDAQINPIRHREGMGLAIWGNETMYVKPSPLQLRSVAMLLIILKYGLENYLEFKLFGTNRKPTWTEVETAIRIFIRDTLFIPGGLYDYQVEVEKVITDTDIDNRVMPVFVGIQPTMDIKTIPVTLGIFNKSVSISV